MKNGYGKFFYSNGSIYEGFWKDDKKTGIGIEKMCNYKGYNKSTSKVECYCILKQNM